MALVIPGVTQSIYESFETNLRPTVDYEIADKLGGLHGIEGLTDAERKGAWAEATPFYFRPARDSPWGTYYSPFAAFSNASARPAGCAGSHRREPSPNRETGTAHGYRTLDHNRPGASALRRF